MKSFAEELIWLPLAASVDHPHMLDAVRFRCERVIHIDSKIYIPSAFVRLGLAGGTATERFLRDYSRMCRVSKVVALKVKHSKFLKL